MTNPQRGGERLLPNVAAMKLQDILAKLGEMPEAHPHRGAQQRRWPRQSFDVLGDHGTEWRHPDGELFAAITRDFGGLDTLQARFNDGGLRVFGSGWVMVTVAPDGKLALETRPNQDTPISDGKRVLSRQ